MKGKGRIKVWDSDGLPIIDFKECDNKKLKRSLKELLEWKL